jgi:type II secretory pathway pseudopilin PulG
MDQEFKTSEENKSIENSMPDNMSQSTGMSQPTESQQSYGIENKDVGQNMNMGMQMPKKPKKGMSKTFMVIVLVVLLIAAGVAAFLWRDMTAKSFEDNQAASIKTLQKSVDSLRGQLTAESSKSPTGQLTCTPVAPSATIISSIKSSITSGNTVALGGYMASSVSVVSADTGGVVMDTSDQAVATITSFITGATAPWNFDLTSTVLNKYTASVYGKYFPISATVGLSANKKVISFNYDCNAKISAVLLSPTEAPLQ